MEEPRVEPLEELMIHLDYVIEAYSDFVKMQMASQEGLKSLRQQRDTAAYTLKQRADAKKKELLGLIEFHLSNRE